MPVHEAKWAFAGEAGDVPDIAEDPGGADRADAVEAGQPGSGGGDRFGEPLVAVFEFAVEHHYVGEQLGRELPPGSPGDVARADGRQQRLGLRGGQEPRCTSRNQL